MREGKLTHEGSYHPQISINASTEKGNKGTIGEKCIKSVDPAL